MSIVIYYFTGTGNSLHVARRLQAQLLDANLVPIVSALDSDTIAPQADTVGIVFPLYVTTVPVPVKRFLQKLALDNVSYLFAVMTRGGTMSYADLHMKRYLGAGAAALKAFFVVDMAYNTPLGIMPVTPPSARRFPDGPERIAEIDAAVEEQVGRIAEIVASRGAHFDDNPFDASWGRRFMSELMRRTGGDSEGRSIGYFADNTCVGCGTCASVCLSRKITAGTDGRPVWQDDVNCFFCYACFNYCPQQAILINRGLAKYLEKRGRYHHPGVSAADIAAQKS